jgi:Raf kinase inhibitor-like YbhB/YbcL family protein
MPNIPVTSKAFEHEATIPVRHTCDGEDLSPALAWGPGPEGTVSYALIMDDPDAPVGTWVHWVAWNLKGRALPEGVGREVHAPEGFVEGKNSWGRNRYGGPCPPSGTHRYFFKIYALDRELPLDSSANKSVLVRAMEGHILAEGELMGRYSRKR